jgi:predicted AAA+ superfamily ATPase
MLIKREITDIAISLSKAFRVVTITGPRQAGKTVLAKMCFPQHKQFDLDDPQLQMLWKSDPKAFFADRQGLYFLDEFQNTPDMLNYIKIIADEVNVPGQFILTGSNQFEFMPRLSQSLAGRTALLKLLPLTWKEMHENDLPGLWNALQRGFYPALLEPLMNPDAYYNAYLGTYLERDIRSLALVRDLSQFRLFLSLLAGRTGCELNKNKLSADTGVDVKTISHWLSLLEISSIIFYLRPWYKNWKKRIVKSPKLYFTDTGLVCHLLGIPDGITLQNHPLRGEIFETYVMGEVLKHYHNRGQNPGLYYLKERNGIEVDLIVDHGINQTLMEIKSGSTMNPAWLDNLKKCAALNLQPHKLILAYGSFESFTMSSVNITGFADIGRVLEM